MNEEFHRRSGGVNSCAKSFLIVSLSFEDAKVEYSKLKHPRTLDAPTAIFESPDFVSENLKSKLHTPYTKAKTPYKESCLFISGLRAWSGGIRRDKKDGNIVGTMADVDHDKHMEQPMSAAVMDRFRWRAFKPYAQGTVLLVAFEEIKLYERSAWI